MNTIEFIYGEEVAKIYECIIQQLKVLDKKYIDLRDSEGNLLEANQYYMLALYYSGIRLAWLIQPPKSLETDILAILRKYTIQNSTTTA